MRSVTEKVMGNSVYLVNPCVIVCPFAGSKCSHGRFRMNGACKPSQLYSHWESMHKGNPAAAQLVVRWRAAIKNKLITLTELDTCAPVQLTDETMEDEAQSTEGYEPLREVPKKPDHFPKSFAYGSTECFVWLQATNML